MVKSPLNYIGNKFKLLPQILPLLPTKINTFVDLFCGGGDVCANVTANTVRANDINFHVIELFETFQCNSIDSVLEYIDQRIEEYQLSKVNKEGFERFRDFYNANPSPIDLYVLGCYSFNNQFRFNSKHEYNSSFGKNRSYFTDAMRNNLINFHKAICEVQFTSLDFVDYDLSNLTSDDFVYADPPYLSTCGSYNDGKRGFRGWSEKDEFELYERLKLLNENNVKWALSNNLSANPLLHNFIVENDLTVHKINTTYKNCNYQKKDKSDAQEVLITNF